LKFANIPGDTVNTLRWLISIRYTIALAFLVVLTASALVYAQPLDSILVLLSVDLVYLLANCLYSILLTTKPSPGCIEVIRQTQLPVELMLCSVAIYLSGGVLTPMFIIYMLSILVSIILLDAVGVYRTAGLAALMYCGMALLELYQVLPYVRGYWGDHDFYEIATPVTYALYVLTVTSMLMLLAFIASRVAALIAERNARIEAQLGDLHTLYNMATGLGNITDELEMLRFLASTLKNLQSASHCLVAMVGKEGRIDIRANTGVSPDALLPLRNLSVDSPLFAPLFQDGKPIIIEDTATRPEFARLRISPVTSSAYIFPIKSDAGVLGAFSLSFDRVKPLSREYHEMLSTVAAQAGVALQRARLFSDTQRMALEMSTLYSFGLQTGSTLSTDEVLKRTGTNIEKLMKPDTYYIALYDEATEMLSFELFIESGQPMPKMRASISEGGLTASIVRSREPLLVQDWLSDGAPYNAVAKKIGADMLSYLGVPMLAEDRVIGVLSVQSARPLAFTEHEERLLSALAAQTAMAFENARLHQQAQEQATLDSLTQIYNHGYFLDLAQKAVAEAKQGGHPVSLIMLDADHFKKYNDSYGHVAGNNVLKMVANVLKTNTKQSDAAARWGGEEFVLLLPHADLRDAQRVAKRIQKAIALLRPLDGRGQIIPSPTVSQGISTYPDPAPSLNALIEQADAALYYAKEHGRNQLTICEARDVMRTILQTNPLQTSDV
jgi:diguanylate cyclase (GGDEF)-like protein